MSDTIPSPVGPPPARAAAAVLPRVLDRYLLPRVAFVLVSLASLVGVTLTGLRLGLDGWPVHLGRWGTYWVLALLIGAELWRLLYLRPALRLRPAAGAMAYGQAMLALYRTWQRVLLPVAVALAGASVWLHAGRGAGSGPWMAATALTLGVAAVSLIATWRRADDATNQYGGGWVAVVALAAAVALLVGRDVVLQHGPWLWLLVPVRVLHAWAFSAWLGGALWNIFIAVPAGQRHLHLDAVILANIQLERFRVVVRLAFPILIGTGLIQVWAIFGWHLTPLVTTLWGYLILAKIGLILALVVVFITCPMWRACSPIRGVCNLDDLD